MRRYSLAIVTALAALAPAWATAQSPSVGYQPALLVRDATARVAVGKQKGKTAHLLSGTAVELLRWSKDEAEAIVLLDDRRVVRLPSAAVNLHKRKACLAPETLHEMGKSFARPPVSDLPWWLLYRHLARSQVSIWLADVEFSLDSPARFEPVLAHAFDRHARGSRRFFALASKARGQRAAVAVNGTFFVNQGRLNGQPLGSFIVNGRVHHSYDDRTVCKRRRSYLAWTSRKRFVMGETDLGAAEILRKNHLDDFALDLLTPGERIVSLIGGLGRLAVDGDAGAWRRYAGKQFPHAYYGTLSRRPQTLVGIDPAGTRLLLAVQEGRPHSKEPLTLPELAQVLVAYGASDLAFADGGGSAHLVIMGREVVRVEYNGRRRLLSSALFVTAPLSHRTWHGAWPNGARRYPGRTPAAWLGPLAGPR